MEALRLGRKPDAMGRKPTPDRPTRRIRRL
jgi:hypothetical protein